MEARVITAEIALGIISSYKQITEAGVPVKGVEITNISFSNPTTGMAWEYEDGTPYAIVNFNAITPWRLVRAVEQYQDEEFQDAVNNNLSLQMSAEQAKTFSKGSFGELTCREIELKDKETGEPTGEKSLVAHRFTKAVAVDAKAFDFKAMLAKKAEAKEGVANNA